MEVDQVRENVNLRCKTWFQFSKYITGIDRAEAPIIVLELLDSVLLELKVKEIESFWMHLETIESYLRSNPSNSIERNQAWEWKHSHLISIEK